MFVLILRIELTSGFTLALSLSVPSCCTDEQLAPRVTTREKECPATRRQDTTSGRGERPWKTVANEGYRIPNMEDVDDEAKLYCEGS